MEDAARAPDRRLAPSLVMALGAQLAAGLAEVHRRGRLHGGVRPDAIELDLTHGTAHWRDAGAETVDPLTRLAWCAPEQTGRLDRAPDARADLYALGLVLHRWLTGAPVLVSDDALAWIHWQLAGRAPEPHAVDASIPPMLSAIVTKLLAKAPDDRYQSAASLADDLARCSREWGAHGRIEPFVLDAPGRAARLVLPAQLVGRRDELAALLAVHADVQAGRAASACVLVEGWAGVGKTALVEAFADAVRREGARWIAGKFDQVVRGVPLGAPIQAFRDLVRQLLGESEAELAAVRAALLAALGDNVPVLAEVIPEIVHVVGPQPAPVPLPPAEAQNRFERVLQRFVGALARPGRPLVLFLDDLHWADAATLGLLEPLLAGGEVRGLLLVGACRDAELHDSPALVRALAALEAAGAAPRRIALRPLGEDDVCALVAETLGVERADARPLARIVRARTDGNPFFVGQLLQALQREGHLRLDAGSGRWTWRLESIEAAPLPDDVVSLLARRIDRLAPRTRHALTLAACIGNRFEGATLAVVSELGEDALAPALDEAVAEGLLVPVAAEGARGTAYAFVHDRVQQAAYALIAEDRRAPLHLAVGRLLRPPGPPATLETRRLYDVVYHLGMGLPALHDAQERRDVAALHLEAARRAKASSARDAALAWLEAAQAMLDTDDAPDDETLAFELGLELAESRYLGGRFDAAQALLDRLLARAGDAVARARVRRLQAVQQENLGHYEAAIALVRDGIAALGIALPTGEDATRTALDAELAAIDRLRGGRAISTLVDLPTMGDAGLRMAMAMLTDVWSATYIAGAATLSRLVSATMVRLTLEHGQLEESAYGYVTHAISVGPFGGAYDEALAWGELALAVNQRFDDRRRRAKIQQQFHAHVAIWCRPFDVAVAYAREACRSGLDAGDFLYAAYAAGTQAWPAMLAADDLERFEADLAPNVALAERLKNPAFADSVRALIGWSRALRGTSAAPLSLSWDGFDERAYLARHADNPFFSAIHAVAHLHVCALLGTPAEASEAARISARTAHALAGTQWPVVHAFWHAWVHAQQAGMPGAAREEVARRAARDDVARAHALYATLARHAPRNYGAPALLLSAQLARLDGEARRAMAEAEEAIECAARDGAVSWEALAHETLAAWLAADGRARLGALHAGAARAAYARWRAHAKVARLADATRHDGPDDASIGSVAKAPSDSPASRTDELDLRSVVKSAQAIAAETARGALIERLLSIVVENAGAERGALVVEGDEGGAVHVLGRAEAALPLDGDAAAGSVPLALVRFVRRTREPLVLAGPELAARAAGDPWLRARGARAVAVLPLAHGGRLAGVLVLEHGSVDAAFTPARLEVLRILATQAAIALDNTRLVQELEAENSYLRRDLIANVTHDLRTPLVSMRGYLELLAGKGETLGAAERAEYLAIARRRTEQLARLVDELFELARLDFKGMTLQREPFDLRDLASDVLQTFRLVAEGTGVRLVLEAPAGLSPVDADLGLLERVFENLVGNALRHTPPGGVVGVRLEARADAVRVVVHDSGSGIASEDLPHVFERHWRGAQGGAGLGLAITRRILELHGAGIAVQSAPGEGTRFTFELPTASARTGRAAA